MWFIIIFYENLDKSEIKNIFTNNFSISVEVQILDNIKEFGGDISLCCIMTPE